MREIFYLHGMGGNASDWLELQRISGGTAISLNPDCDSFSELCLDTTKKIQLLAKTNSNVLLCGYSLGGRVALSIAESLEKSLTGKLALLLLSAGLGFSSVAEREDRAQKDLDWAALADQDLNEFWQKWYQQALFSTFPHLPLSLRETWIRDRKTINSLYLRRQLVDWSPAQHEYLRPTLQNLGSRMPVYYAAGSEDSVYRKLGESFAAQTQIRVEILPGIGHILPLEAPTEIAQIISKINF